MVVRISQGIYIYKLYFFILRVILYKGMSILIILLNRWDCLTILNKLAFAVDLDLDTSAS